MATKGHKCADTVIIQDQYEEKIQAVFPKADEDLIDFLNRCKISGSLVMLCPRCSTVFDKKAAKNIEGFQPQSKRKEKWADKRPMFSFEKANIPFKDTSPTTNQKKGPVKPSLLPPNPQIINGYFLVVKSPITSLHLQNGLRKSLENLQLSSGYFLVGRELLEIAIRMK